MWKILIMLICSFGVRAEIENDQNMPVLEEGLIIEEESNMPEYTQAQQSVHDEAVYSMERSILEKNFKESIETGNEEEVIELSNRKLAFDPNYPVLEESVPLPQGVHRKTRKSRNLNMDTYQRDPSNDEDLEEGDDNVGVKRLEKGDYEGNDRKNETNNEDRFHKDEDKSFTDLPSTPNAPSIHARGLSGSMRSRIIKLTNSAIDKTVCTNLKSIYLKSKQSHDLYNLQKAKCLN